MPGYTHLQRAQPITFAHQLLAYGMMFSRDIGRLSDAAKRMNVSPLGACALAGTTHPIDRQFTASQLGFDGICHNSLDAVSDRDFCVELCSALALVMTHLSRLAEELILWTSWEFRFVELSDATPPAPPSCRRRRTRTWPSSSAARPAGSTATS